MISRDMMTMTETNAALERLNHLPSRYGTEIPDELMSFLRGTIHERDAGAARLARFLREAVPHVSV